MGPEITFLPATADHARELALTIRPGDRAEVMASGGLSPEETALSAIRWSRNHGGGAWAGLIDGQVAGIFGIGRRTLISRRAIPWLLTGTLVDRHPRLFWKASKGIVQGWLAEYEELEQYVDARYTQALRWAKRLGFEVGPAVPFGVQRLPFHRITMRRNHASRSGEGAQESGEDAARQEETAEAPR